MARPRGALTRVRAARAVRRAPWGLCALLLCLAACSGAAVSTGVEDKARRDLPIAVCRKPLVPADLTETGAPHPEAYWKVLVPSFHGFGGPLAPDARSCVGDDVQPTGSTGSPDQRATRAPAVDAQAATITPSEDGIELVWLRTVGVSDRVARGPLAVVRPRPSEIDVYSLGLYEGSARHSRFELLHLASATVVSARNESCADAKVDGECESVADLYLVSGGTLTPTARITVERMQQGTMKEVGKVKYRLTTDPFVVEPTAVKVKEHLSVRDVNDEEVRKADGERVFTLAGAELTSKQASIWPQPSSAPPPGPPAKP
jgi:hypothetical protein